VFNLLLAIGAGLISPPAFSTDHGWYPFPFNLRPFSEMALYDMQIFELPRGMKPATQTRCRAERRVCARGIGTGPLVFSRVGELYAQMPKVFRTSPSVTCLSARPARKRLSNGRSISVFTG
jgi:hypothetical protein